MVTKTLGNAFHSMRTASLSGLRVEAAMPGDRSHHPEDATISSLHMLLFLEIYVCLYNLLFYLGKKVILWGIKTSQLECPLNYQWAIWMGRADIWCRGKGKWSWIGDKAPKKTSQLPRHLGNTSIIWISTFSLWCNSKQMCFLHFTSQTQIIR